jgi:hypothetical protein
VEDSVPLGAAQAIAFNSANNRLLLPVHKVPQLPSLW